MFKSWVEGLFHGIQAAPDGARTSDLERLRTGPTTVSGKAIVAALDREAELTALGLGSLDLDAVPHTGG